MEDKQYYLIPSDEDIRPDLKGQVCVIGILSKYEHYSFDMVRVNTLDNLSSRWNRVVISKSRLIPVAKEVADIMEGYKLEDA